MRSLFPRNPASLTEEQRDEFRRSLLGNREGLRREDVTGGALYYSESPGRFSLVGFVGKAVKPAFNYYYTSEEKRAAKALRWAEDLAATVKARAERAEARKNATHGMLVGTILSSLWGWEQTNVDFFEIVRVVSDKVVEVRPISSRKEYDSDMTGKAMPIPGAFIGEVMRKRANQRGIRLTSYSWASIWDGKPEPFSNYA